MFPFWKDRLCTQILRFQGPRKLGPMCHLWVNWERYFVFFFTIAIVQLAALSDSRGMGGHRFDSHQEHWNFWNWPWFGLVKASAEASYRFNSKETPPSDLAFSSVKWLALFECRLFYRKSMFILRKPVPISVTLRNVKLYLYVRKEVLRLEEWTRTSAIVI